MTMAKSCCMERLSAYLLERLIGLMTQEVGEIHYLCNHIANIVALLVVGGHNPIQRGVRIYIGVAFHARWVFQIIRRQEAQQLLRQQHGVAVVFGDEMDHAGVGHMGLGAAQLFRRDGFAGNTFDHLRAGGFSEVTLWSFRDNSRANALYELLGFTPEGATQRREQFGGLVEVRLRRAL